MPLASFDDARLYVHILDTVYEYGLIYIDSRTVRATESLRVLSASSAVQLRRSSM